MIQKLLTPSNLPVDTTGGLRAGTTAACPSYRHPRPRRAREHVWPARSRCLLTWPTSGPGWVNRRYDWRGWDGGENPDSLQPFKRNHVINSGGSITKYLKSWVMFKFKRINSIQIKIIDSWPRINSFVWKFPKRVNSRSLRVGKDTALVLKLLSPTPKLTMLPMLLLHILVNYASRREQFASRLRWPSG